MSHPMIAEPKEYTIVERQSAAGAVYIVCRVLKSYDYPVPLGGRVKYQHRTLNAALDQVSQL